MVRLSATPVNPSQGSFYRGLRMPALGPRPQRHHGGQEGEERDQRDVEQQGGVAQREDVDAPWRSRWLAARARTSMRLRCGERRARRVQVTDRGTRRTLTLRAGHSYLARAVRR